MAGLEELSMRIYRQLDSTGYSHKIIRIRMKIYSILSKLRSRKSKARKIIYSGSKGEGMAQWYESDEDVLYFDGDSVCIDDPVVVDIIPAHITVFAIRNTEPGYCKLELLRQGTIHDNFISNCLLPFNEKVLLSSQLLVLEVFNTEPHESGETRTLTGPAMSSTLSHGYLFDHVRTFSCVCRTILEDWANRPRANDWPAPSLRQSVLQMTGNLVATGPDDSETKHLEWRYCFNEIEILIGGTLNDTQLKLYKVLKIINTDIFKRRGLALTSFIMKNIVFWLAETHPQSQFLPGTLFHWVRESLRLLKHYVETNNIPYYMIPGRNFLKEKVKESDRPKLIQVIYDVLSICPILLLNGKTFRKYIDFYPPNCVI